MKTFFRICVTLCLFMLAFSLIANFVSSLGAFDFAENIGTQVGDTDNVLEEITGLSDPNMQSVWLGVTGLTLIGVVALCAFIRSPVPLGIHLFGVVFWTSWIRMNSILSYGGFIPGELLTVFTAGVMFIFIAAIIGMLTGGN